VAGRLSNCRYCRVLLGVMTLLLVLTVLVATNTWNPWPGLVAWWDKVTALSEPGPAWETRLGGVPDIAAVTISGQVVVASRGFVEGYDGATGALRWHIDAQWALPAGDVVVVRPRSTNPDEHRSPDTGYSVVDPVTGTVIWGDREARAVWAFSDRIVDLVCPDSGDCLMRGRSHGGGGRQLWAVGLPADARTVNGANPQLAGVRDPAEWFGDASAGSPGRLPPVIGLPINGRIHVVDTVEGVHVREVTPPNRETRVAFSGERLLFSHATRDDSGCRFRVEAFDYRSDTLVWSSEGFDLDTASGAGCEQRRDPLGAGNHLIGLRGDNHPALLSVANGRPTWVGVPGERVLATDGLLAVIEAADRRTLRVVDLLDPELRPVWSGEMGLRPEAAITRDYVIINDVASQRVIVLSHFGAANVAEFKTRSIVVGYGYHGLIVANGRRIGFVPLLA
jgi:outer membrane protein assembly factor BamB